MFDVTKKKKRKWKEKLLLDPILRILMPAIDVICLIIN